MSVLDGPLLTKASHISKSDTVENLANGVATRRRILRSKISSAEHVGCNRVIHTIYKSGELDEPSTCAEIALVQKLCLCVKPMLQ